MKKKLAMLLAIVMVLGVITPMNLMAAGARPANISIHPGAIQHYAGAGNAGRHTSIVDRTLFANSEQRDSAGNNVGNVGRGADLVIIFDDTIRTPNHTFRIVLEGAQWNWRAEGLDGFLDDGTRANVPNYNARHFGPTAGSGVVSGRGGRMDGRFTEMRTLGTPGTPASAQTFVSLVGAAPHDDARPAGAAMLRNVYNSILPTAGNWGAAGWTMTANTFGGHLRDNVFHNAVIENPSNGWEQDNNPVLSPIERNAKVAAESTAIRNAVPNVFLQAVMLLNETHEFYGMRNIATVGQLSASGATLRNLTRSYAIPDGPTELGGVWLFTNGNAALVNNNAFLPNFETVQQLTNPAGIQSILGSAALRVIEIPNAWFTAYTNVHANNGSDDGFWGALTGVVAPPANWDNFILDGNFRSVGIIETGFGETRGARFARLNADGTPATDDALTHEQILGQLNQLINFMSASRTEGIARNQASSIATEAALLAELRAAMLEIAEEPINITNGISISNPPGGAAPQGAFIRLPVNGGGSGAVAATNYFATQDYDTLGPLYRPGSNGQLVGYTIRFIDDANGRTTEALVTVTGRDNNANISAEPVGTLVARVGDFIVIPLVIDTDAADTEIMVSIHGPATGVHGRRPISAITGQGFGSTTTTFVALANMARGRVLLNDLRITENSPNVIQSGWFVIVPPVDYNLRTIIQTGAERGNFDPIRGLTLSASGGLTGTTLGAAVSFPVKERDPMLQHIQDRIAIAVYLDVNQANVPLYMRSYTGSITLSNLVLEPISLDPGLMTNMGQTLSVGVYNLGSGRNLPGTAGLGGNDYILTRAGGTFINSFSITGYNDVTGAWNVPQAGLAGTVGNPTLGLITPNMRNTANVTNRPAVDAVVRSEWGLTYSAAAPANLFSGRIDQVSSTVTLRTEVLDSWSVRRDTVFTLVDRDGNELEDVKITRIEITSATSLRTASGNNLPSRAANANDPNRFYWNRAIGTAATNWLNNYDGNPMQYANVFFNRTGNSFALRDLYEPVNRGALPAISFNVHLSAHPDFQDEVWLQVSGGGIEDNVNLTAINTQRVHIANFARLLNITAETTSVQIGYLIYDVANITIEENATAFGDFRQVLNQGDFITIEIGAHGRQFNRNRVYMGFNPGAIITTNGVFRNTQMAVIDGIMRFPVSRTNANASGSIVISNISLDIDRTVPWGDYDLIVNVQNAIPGLFTNNFLSRTVNAATPNVTWLYDRFNVDGMRIINAEGEVVPYVRMVTQGDSPQTVNEVRIRERDDFATVDGVRVDMGIAPELNPADGRLYVPLRFVSYILGVPEHNIIWDGFLRQVTILTADGRTIQFLDGSEIFWVNGQAISTYEPDQTTLGRPYVHQVHERFFVPFRALGHALGIDVSWDSDTREGIYSPRGSVISNGW